MNCPTCTKPVHLHVEITGGCSGHGEDEYCYCDTQDVHVFYQCATKECTKKGRIERTTVSELSDRFSLERWLNEHYTHGRVA